MRFEKRKSKKLCFQIKELIESRKVGVNEVDENNVSALRNFHLDK